MIADSSAMAAFYLNEDVKSLIEQELLREDTVTLDLALKEILNAVSKRVKMKKLREDEGLFILDKILESVEKEAIRIMPQHGLLPKALELSIRNGISIYDALFIAAAIEEGRKLLTLDTKQGQAARKEGVRVVELKSDSVST